MSHAVSEFYFPALYPAQLPVTASLEKKSSQKSLSKNYFLGWSASIYDHVTLFVKMFA